MDSACSIKWIADACSYGARIVRDVHTADIATA